VSEIPPPPGSVTVNNLDCNLIATRMMWRLLPDARKRSGAEKPLFRLLKPTKEDNDCVFEWWTNPFSLYRHPSELLESFVVIRFGGIPSQCRRLDSKFNLQ
jgi:hypothetical protein